MDATSHPQFALTLLDLAVEVGVAEREIQLACLGALALVLFVCSGTRVVAVRRGRRFPQCYSDSRHYEANLRDACLLSFLNREGREAAC